ncbi:hypothetical protein CLV58_13117 [Spirosoma oryzae]|uniref:Uncharacterized protein n=1 Tax=Spirosoma oryzae TaxID=1469603 RepID=A0A2T0S307_9BACT|nr:hypothetical protein [Spirosoma oryzae]PRY27799.1 hypothetical protein CLV58_13117 [Spirosoma oryzae]
MNQLLREFSALPLWAQLMLISVVLVVGHFWLSMLGKGLWQRVLATDNRTWTVLRFAAFAGLIAYASVSFCLGHDEQGQALQWSVYARGAFVVEVLYLTPLLLRVFQK